MPKCLDCETCFYCNRFVSPRHEHDHFPIPRRAGGPVFRGCEVELAMELLVALADSMPERYRVRIFSDPLSVRLRALPDWSTEELVASVLAATTTEARLYLAQALSKSWDWRSRTERHPLDHQRPPQDSNVGPAD